MSSPAPFICIGQARAGSTWLYDLISATNCFFTPPVKELNYLSAIAYRGGGLTFDQRVSDDVTSQALYFAQCLNTFAVQFSLLNGSHLKASGVQNHLRFWKHYLFSDLTIDSYVRILKGFGAPGFDVSPEYILLPPEHLLQVQSQIPEMKLIVLLRHPPSRFRSHLGLYGHDGLVHARWDDVLHMENHSLVATNLATLFSKYPTDQIFLGFTDDIRHHPKDFVAAVAAFLGIRMPDFIPPAANAGLNTSRETAQLACLFTLFKNEARSLKQLVPHNWPDMWLNIPEGLFDTDAAYIEATKMMHFGSGVLSTLCSRSKGQ